MRERPPFPPKPRAVSFASVRTCFVSWLSRSLKGLQQTVSTSLVQTPHFRKAFLTRGPSSDAHIKMSRAVSNDLANNLRPFVDVPSQSIPGARINQASKTASRGEPTAASMAAMETYTGNRASHWLCRCGELRFGSPALCVVLSSLLPVVLAAVPHYSLSCRVYKPGARQQVSSTSTRILVFEPFFSVK